VSNDAYQTSGAPSDRLVGIIAGGLFLQLLGGFLAGLLWPGTDAATGDEQGNPVVAIFGLAVVSLGTLIALVGVIGFGVLVGLRVRDRERERAAES